MMKNKIKLKKYLIITGIVSIGVFILFLMMNLYEYHRYTANFNQTISTIIIKVKEKVPSISNDEMIEILNSGKEENKSFFEAYGIDVDQEALLLENDQLHPKFLLVNSIFLLTTMVILLIVFLLYDHKKNKEIYKIINYIEEINRKNYSLHLDEMSEDELSILKNEIYKTMIMLKESAENSLKDKKELKNSLEDISHQLKTPLTSILVILDNLIEDPNMDQSLREEFIRDIKREVVSINFLVQALLKLSKFDSNTIHFVKEKRLLKAIIDESVQNVSVLCDLKNVTLDIKGDEKAQVSCDFRWQVEAVTNIIKNCVEHSKENSNIEITYEQNKVYSLISVRDFGEGISQKDLPHIFERFYKGSNAKEDSIGIGLALSKTMIEKDNGTITVESDGNGTKFIIKYFNI